MTRTVTLHDTAAQWQAHHVRIARTPTDQKVIASRCRRYLFAYFAPSTPVDTLAKADLVRYRTWLARHEISLNTVGHILAELRQMLRWAEDNGLLARAPIPHRLIPRLPERAPRPFTEAEEATLAGLPDPHGFVNRLALATGLRWGELTRVKAADLRDGVLVVAISKSKRVRRIPVPPALVAECRGRVGLLVPFRSASSYRKTIRRMSGIADFNPHRMRHTFACRWLERGGSLAALQELLGHRSITTTQIYGRLSGDMVKREAERVWQNGEAKQEGVPMRSG